jgi:DNA-binding NarL/FixJ family response regulator
MRHVDEFGSDILLRLSLTSLLGRLDPREQEVLRLWGEGLTLAEIAAQIGPGFQDNGEISGSGVRYIRDNALRKLREWASELH